MGAFETLCYVKFCDIWFGDCRRRVVYVYLCIVEMLVEEVVMLIVNCEEGTGCSNFFSMYA